MRTILAATDFSVHASRALERAAISARRSGARLTLMHGIDPRRTDGMHAALALARARLLDESARIAVIAGAKPAVLALAGEPAKAIVAAALDVAADLVVMGAHRPRWLRHAFIESTAAHVLRARRVPVLSVGRSPSGPYRRVLIAADLSAPSGHAAHWAVASGLTESAELSVIHAFEPYAKGKLIYAGASGEAVAAHVRSLAHETVVEIVDGLRREGVNVARRHVMLEEAHPVPAILAAAEKSAADLLVVGTRGHGGIRRFLLGTIAGAVLREVACDVLAVPPGTTLPHGAGESEPGMPAMIADDARRAVRRPVLAPA